MLLHLCLAALDALWLAPLLMRLWEPAYEAAWWIPVGLFVALVLWLAWGDLSAHYLHALWSYRLSWIVFALLSCLCLLKLLYPQYRLLDFTWIRLALDRLPRIDGGVQAELVAVGLGLFLWLRTVYATGRDLTSLGVLRTFGWDALLLLCALAVLGAAQDLRPLYAWIPVYLGVGAFATTLALSDERAALAHSEGQALPWRRTLQTVAVLALLSALAYALARSLVDPVQRVLWWLAPILEMSVVALQLLLVLLVVLASQLGQWLGARLGLAGTPTGAQTASLSELADELRRRLEATESEDILLAPWLLVLLRFLPLLIILIAAATLSWFVLRRSRYRRRAITTEEASSAAVERTGAARQALERLRDWMGLARRLGVGRQLLAAISIQNIYANVCRIAAERGHPRHPSMSPDTYLPLLVQAYEGQEATLRRITTAYMRVHYGDQPVQAEELHRLQLAYRELRRSATLQEPRDRV